MSNSLKRAAQRRVRVKDGQFLEYLGFPEGMLMPLIGKRPFVNDWVNSTVFRNGTTVERCTRKNLNMGFRIPKGVVVIDVDKKRNGIQSFDRLCKDFSLKIAAWPRVNTGDGGFHLYLRVDPRHELTLEFKDKYPGIEFRSHTLQVVCAGSVHPDTKKHYIFDTSTPDLHKMPMMPAKLFDLVKKGLRQLGRKRKTSIGNGNRKTQSLSSNLPARLSPSELGAMLAGLDPMDYQVWDDHFKLMCACHHATRGLGFDVYANWAARDFCYSSSRSDNHAIWQKLDPDRENGYTVSTLNRLLISKGRADLAVPVIAPELDFSDDPPEPLDDLAADEIALRKRADQSPDRNALALRTLNDNCALLVAGNKVRVAITRDKLSVEFLSVADFERLYANRIVKVADGNKKGDFTSLGNAWLKWDARKEAHGVTYCAKSKFFTLIDGKLNLWRGFAIAPDDNACCNLFYEMIFNVICGGDAILYEYVLNWTAWKFQNPCELPDVAVALTGDKGVGKSLFADQYRKIIGASHAILLKQMEAITGRFNGHFDGMALVIGDEVTWGGRLKDDGVIKNLITQEYATVERKGVDMHGARNMAGLILLSNEEWIVPATRGERRYCAIHVPSHRKVPMGAPLDHENRLYWKMIVNELDGGGRNRFLFDMLSRHLGGWHARDTVPQTQNLGRQILEGLRGYERGYYNLLQSAVFNDGDFARTKDWTNGTLRLAAKDLLQMMSWGNMHFQPTVNGLSRVLREFGWKHIRSQTVARDRLLAAPSLDDACRIFAERIGYNPFEEE